MNQLVLGASLPLAIGVLIYAVRGFRAGLVLLIALPACMACSMLWAVAPDLPRVLGRADLYRQLAQDPRTDLFFWHYTIDQYETDATWYAVPFVALFLILLLMAWRELRRAEGEA